MIFDSINKIFNREPGAVVAATAITTSGTSAYLPALPIGLAETQAAYNNAIAQGLSNLGMAGAAALNSAGMYGTLSPVHRDVIVEPQWVFVFKEDKTSKTFIGNCTYQLPTPDGNKKEHRSGTFVSDSVEALMERCKVEIVKLKLKG